MDTIGGYRLVRKLGEGDRAIVWLGHASTGSASGDGSVAAVKVYRETVGIRDIDREIEALTRASSAHLVELTDVATAPDGRPCLVMRRIEGPPLTQVLARRSVLEAGEVVTALAPVTAALAELPLLNKRATVAIGKALKSAVANARQQGIGVGDLMIKD
ncbi:MAG: protein kinase, partial [Actinomycetota bacterium]